MSALTDLFTSMANKIRSKVGGSQTYTPTQMISAIDDVYNAGAATATASMTADLTKELATLTGSNPTYTTTKNAILIGTWGSGGASFWIKVNGVTVFNQNNSSYCFGIGSGVYGLAVPAGATIEIRNVISISPQIHIYEMQ